MANVARYAQHGEDDVQESQTNTSYADTYVYDGPSCNINATAKGAHFQADANRIQEIQYEHQYVGISDPEVRYKDVNRIPQGQPAATANKEKQPRSSISTFIIAASLLVVLGLALAGIALFVQEKQRLDEANKLNAALAKDLQEKDQTLNETFLELLSAMKSDVKELRKANRELNETFLEAISAMKKNTKSFESCDELRDKYGISESGIYELKQKNSSNSTVYIAQTVYKA